MPVRIMRSMQLHLLDGTYELFRSFFGAPSRSAPDGREIGAIAGIIGSTLNLLREPGVTHYNTPALAFWRQALTGAPVKDFEETMAETARWSGSVFRFRTP